MVRQLLPTIGFSWTMRAIGFIQVGCLIIAFIFLKPRVPPRTSGSLVDFASFKELDYTCYAIGAYLYFWGIYVPFFFLSSYARETRGMDYSSALDLLLLMNGVGVIGRVLPNFAADKVGAVNMFVPMGACTALLMYCWAAVGDVDGLWAWAAFYGISAGGIQSLFPAALSSLTVDPRKQGTRIGMVFTIVSFAVLTGPPIAGALISKSGYLAAQMFAGSSIALGSVSIWVAREVRRKRSGQKLLSKV
jgi:predicted MFS family arabinose efflux permease